MACQAYRNSFYFSHYSKYMNLFVHNHFADLRFVSIYLWQNKRIGENGPSLMRHIYKRIFLKIEELRNYVKKKEWTSEQCHEFVKKIKIGLYYGA
jgi:hypothetical protein